MSQPAPDQHAAPTPAPAMPGPPAPMGAPPAPAPLSAPPAPAPIAPAPPQPAPMAPADPVTVQMPTTPAQALDLGVPLQHAASAPVAPVAPGQPGAPAEPSFTHPAAPSFDAPQGAWASDAAAPVGDVAPGSQPIAAVGELPSSPAPAPAVDPSTAWWSIGYAMLLAVAAIAWQFVSFYAREQLPGVEASGAPLTRYDQIVSSLPIAGSSFGFAPALLLAVAALGFVLAGLRAGYRDTALQGLVGFLAVFALLLTVALPALAG